MSTQTPDPLFNAPEEETTYTAWLRMEVEASLADPRPSIPHEEVERQMSIRLTALKTQSSPRYQS